jgi:hypothetical protein
MDQAGTTPRAVADQLGHPRPSMSQNKYMGRRRPTGAEDILEAIAIWQGSGCLLGLSTGGFVPHRQERCRLVVNLLRRVLRANDGEMLDRPGAPINSDRSHGHTPG